MSTHHSIALGCLAFAFGAGGCQPPAAYQAPAARTVPALEAPTTGDQDGGDVAAIRQLEAACRVRLSGQSAEASITALDRVHEVLGSSCDLETVDHDPLHWRLRCRSDALFESGQYALAGKTSRCAELGNRKASNWECVGAVLASLVDPARADSLESMDAAILGHVDMRPLKPKSESHICNELHQELGYTPEPAWTPVPEDASDDERLYANNQLAWCRAASVAAAMRGGMLGGSPKARATKSTTAGARPSAEDAAPGPADPRATGLPMSLAVLGVGTSWLRSRPDGACPSTGKTPEQEKDCVDARRVDLLLRFTPRRAATTSTCKREGNDAQTALYCLQECVESAAVGQRAASDAPPRAAPLFVAQGQDPSGALPAGWYLKELSDSPGQTLDIARVCSTLQIDPQRCPTGR